MKEYSRTILELIRKCHPFSSELVFLHCMLGPELLVHVPNMLFKYSSMIYSNSSWGKKISNNKLLQLYAKKLTKKNKIKDNKRHFQTLYEIWKQTAWLKMIYNNLGKQFSRVKR